MIMTYGKIVQKMKVQMQFHQELKNGLFSISKTSDLGLFLHIAVVSLMDLTQMR